MLTERFHDECASAFNYSTGMQNIAALWGFPSADSHGVQETELADTSKRSNLTAKALAVAVHWSDFGAQHPGILAGPISNCRPNFLGWSEDVYR